MKIDKSLLGPNQQEWLKQQESLRQTYSFLCEVDEIPDEQTLEIYKNCRVAEFNTSCFNEGTCINPDHSGCAERK